VIVAILDTGIDHDRDASGNITGIHSEFRGQVVDKTGPGEECDPKDLNARRAKYKACLAAGHTDCVNTDTDRDGNGYPLDCLGWNVTAALNKPIDILGDDDTRDKLGHGTHVAGIIAASADGEGVRGVI